MSGGLRGVIQIRQPVLDCFCLYILDEFSPRWAFWNLTKFQAGGFGSAVALLAITGVTGGHDVIPNRLTTFGSRNDVIDGDRMRSTMNTTVLTLKGVANKYILTSTAREADAANSADILFESDDTRELEGLADGADDLIIFRYDFSFALENQTQRPLPAHELNRFIARIEH